MIAVVGGAAVAAGQDTVTIGLVQNLAEDKGGYSIMVGDATFEASAQAPEAGGADAPVVQAPTTIATIANGTAPRRNECFVVNADLLWS